MCANPLILFLSIFNSLALSLACPPPTDSGAFSQVYMAQNRLDPEDIVAIKCIDKKALRGKEDSLENEIKVLRK